MLDQGLFRKAVLMLVVNHDRTFVFWDGPVHTEWCKSLSWESFQIKNKKDPSADSCTKFMPVITCEQDGGWLFQSSFVCVGGSKPEGQRATYGIVKILITAPFKGRLTAPRPTAISTILAHFIC